MSGILKTVALLLLLVISTASASTAVWDDSIYLALVFTNDPIADPAVAAQIAADMTAIGDTYPDFESFWFIRLWDPGEVYCKLTDDAWDDYMSGGFQELRDLMPQYACHVDPSILSKTLRLLSCQARHPVHMAAPFAALDGVAWCEPNGYLGDGNTVEVLELGATSRYRYRVAWGDCPAGCALEHFFEFSVTGSFALMTSEWGDVANDSASWGDVKALFR